jgi:hypothetical protein
LSYARSAATIAHRPEAFERVIFLQIACFCADLLDAGFVSAEEGVAATMKT